MNWGEQGASVMELSHRSFEFVKIARGAEQKLRGLMNARPSGSSKPSTTAC